MSFIIEGFELPDDCYAVEVVFYRNNPDHKFGAGGYVQNIPLKKIVAIPKDHGRLADLDDLTARMYHEAFITDTPLQKWDGGCWIRYKMFENCRDSTPIIFKAEDN